MNFKAFYAVSEGMEVIFEVRFLKTHGSADLRAETAGGAVELEVCEQTADLLGKFLGAANVEGRLTVALTIYKFEERAETFMVIISPTGNYNARCGKKLAIFQDKILYSFKSGGYFLVNKSRYFHDCRFICHDFFNH